MSMVVIVYIYIVTESEKGGARVRPRCMSIVVCQCFKMADTNEKLLAELLKKPGNNVCADCGAKSECVP